MDRGSNAELMEQFRDIDREWTDVTNKYDLKCGEYETFENKYFCESKDYEMKIFEFETAINANKDLNKEMNKICELSIAENEWFESGNEEMNDLRVSVNKVKNELNAKCTKLKDLNGANDEQNRNENALKSLIQTLQNNLKQLQSNKQLQFIALKECQMSLKHKSNEMKQIKAEHSKEMNELQSKLQMFHENELKSNNVSKFRNGKGFEWVWAINDWVYQFRECKCRVGGSAQESELSENEERFEESELRLITLQNECRELKCKYCQMTQDLVSKNGEINTNICDCEKYQKFESEIRRNRGFVQWNIETRYGKSCDW